MVKQKSFVPTLSALKKGENQWGGEKYRREGKYHSQLAAANEANKGTERWGQQTDPAAYYARSASNESHWRERQVSAAVGAAV